ncbi:cyclin-K [Palaemon carinicauda]|uniref:cyclin-K n=1 Tax=Palaemon carinicauda TaxID=392227 RepID=UPI0035B6871D
MTKRSGWYYERRELKQTPSILSGLKFEKEVEQRREGARFIMNVGNKMGLRYETMATGVVFFHRFYMVHTFQEFPRHVTACCCLFLAGKVEETPKKCRDIMKMAKANMDEVTWAEFGTDPREEVMTLERILLQTIKFDFIVEHPYSYLLKYAKGLKGDKKKLPNMVQMAWTFVNDSMCTTLCLQWEPEIIAIALMYLAGKLSKFEVSDWVGRTPKQEKWWDIYVSGITIELLEDICHQVLDLYSPKGAEGSGSLGQGASLESSHISSGGSSSKISIVSSSAVVASAPPSGPSSSSVSGSIAASATTSIVDPPLAHPGSSQKRSATPTKAASQPPSKKAKKEEVKLSPAKPSPVKPDPANPAQSYQYPYQSYSNYPPSYPPSQSSSSSSSSSSTPRYPPYTYPPTTTQGPPPSSQVPPQVPPPSYQTPQRHYPPPAGTAQAPHYTNQPPPPSHYPSSSHPPYHPPPTTSHYAAPPPTNYPPPAHGSSSSYYAAPPSTSNPPPTYPPSGPSSSYAPASSYSHSHSSSRSYYPPP